MAKMQSWSEKNDPDVEAARKNGKRGSPAGLGLGCEERSTAPHEVGGVPVRLEQSDQKDETPEELHDLSTLQDEKKKKGNRIRWHAQAAFKAMDLWPIQAATEEQWVEVCVNAAEEYHSGRFFLEQLGAERFLDPKLFATLWILRNALVEDVGVASAAEEMVIDMMMLGYANALRVQGWVGNLAAQIEAELFDEHGLHERYDRKRGRHTKEGLVVEGMLERFREEMLPLLDRCDRMFIRNLRAIQELRRGPAPNVNIGAAGQVNVAQEQVNARAN